MFTCKLLLFSATFLVVCESMFKEWNISSAILENYDNRLRPDFGIPTKPVEVDVNLVIGSVDRISEVNMDYTMTIYLRQYWRDQRLSFNYSGLYVLPMDGRMTEKLWLPDTYFTNDKDSYLQDVTVKNRMLRIFPQGSIIYGLRLSVTASCVYDLKKFPHDVQNCSLNLESYGYSRHDIMLKWKAPGKGCADGFQDVELPQFLVTDWDCKQKVVNFSSGVYDRLNLFIILERSVGYFVFQTYMPCVMVVCMSWVSFWINYESSPARVALGITTVLTMTTIFTSARSSLPRFSYVKAIDIYLLTCFVFVFTSLLEYAVVNYNFWKLKHRQGRILKQIANGNPSTIPSEDIVAHRLAYSNKPVHFRYSPDLPRKSASSHRMQKHKCTCKHRYTASDCRTFSSKTRFHNQISSYEELSLVALIWSYIKKIDFPAGDKVIVIDRYSRIFFPSAFIMFNAVYWWYYVY